MKKALATILALVMAIGLCSVSWADDPVTLKVDPSVSYTTAPARAADATYKTIAEAITAAQAGDTIALVNDLTVDGDSYTEVKKALTIDFGGCTMTVAAGGGFDVYSDLTLKNGTLECLKWAAWVQSGAKLTVAADMVINATSTDANKGGITVQNTGSEVTVYGKVTAAGGAAISGIGNASDGGVTINIEDGAVVTNTNDGGLGIYYPNTSNLNIKGGTITGATGIYVKCGSVSVTGGTIVGNGAKADYAYYGNGGNPTGEALVIDKCNYPGGDPAVSITGGTFSSTNANAVGSYVGNNATGVVTGFITGGTFSSDVDAYVAADKIVQKDGGAYKVVADGAITSGTYTSQPTVPSGYKATKNDDGTWTVTKISYYYYPSTSDTTTSTTTKGSPKTFDAGVGIYAVTAVLSVTGMAWTAKKRED